MTMPAPLTEAERYTTLLSPREREIATSLALGLSCREIATALNISIKTVDTHRGRVLQKLELANAVALCRFMIRLGMVQP